MERERVRGRREGRRLGKGSRGEEKGGLIEEKRETRGG